MTRPLPPDPPPARAPLRVALVALAAVGVAAGLVLAPDVLGTQAVSSGSLRADRELPYVAAHRGDGASGPENTLAAFRGAVAAGSDLVEADVRLTADGVPVLMHDPTVDRTTDGSGRVADLTFAELRALDAGSWFSPASAGLRVPTFEELLDYLVREATGVHALVELKGEWSVDDAGLLAGSVRSRELAERVVFASFSADSLLALRESDPGIPRAMLFADLPADPVAASAEVDPIAIMTRLDCLRERAWVVDDIHAAGLGVLVYTLNASHDWDRAVRLGVDGIITDQPGGLGSWMADRSGQAPSSSAR